MQTTVIEDAEEASFSLNGMVAGFDENTSAYAHMPTKNPYSHFCFALNIEMTAEEVIQALKNYLEELERGECKQVLCIEKKMMRKEYWQKGGLLRRNLLAMRERLEHERMISAILKAQNGACYDDFIMRMEDSYAEVARLLSEIHQRMKKMTREMYGQFFQHLKSQYDAEPATIAYDEWMMKEGDNSFETLKGKQTLEVAESLRKGLLQFMRTPLQNEIDKVDIERIIYWMPYNYDREYLRSDDFRIQCAKLRTIASWEGDIMKLDYNRYGKYLLQNFHKMTSEERQAFFYLDVMVGLINRDIKPNPSPSQKGREEESAIDIEEMAERLKPIFYNNEENVRQFLEEIDGMAHNDITDLVNRWVKDKRISDYGNSRKGDLWAILYDAGLYSKSRQNWCRRVY